MSGEIYLKPLADPGAATSCKRPKTAAEGPADAESPAFEAELAAADAAAPAVAEDCVAVEPAIESVSPESGEEGEAEGPAGASEDAPVGSATQACDELMRLLEAWSGVSASLPEDAPQPEPAEGAGLPAVKVPADPARVAAAVGTEQDGTEIAALGDAGEWPSAPEMAGQAAAAPVRTAASLPGTAPGTGPDTASGPATGATDPSGLLQAVAGDSGTARVDSLALGGASAALAEARTNPAGMVWRPAHAHAPSVIRQIADAVVTTRESGVEIALSPEELGRVRLVVTGAERAHHVTVWVERPEVMDLVRRNVGLLAEQFGEAGLENASFEFREERGSRGDASAWSDGAEQSREDLPDMTALTARMAVSLPGGRLSADRRLDIRL